MKYIDFISTVDPRGYFISCTEFQFEKHVKLNHPDITKDGLEDAIKNPDYIFQSEECENRDVYFGSPDECGYKTKVAVQISCNYGEVITAFHKPAVSGNIREVKYVKPGL